MADQRNRPSRSAVPRPGSGQAEPGQQPLRMILPEHPPHLSPAAAAVLLRILRAAMPVPGPPERDQLDSTATDRRAA